MLTKNENLFHVIARDLVASSLSETYIIAGKGFQVFSPSSEVRRAIDVAQALVSAPTAADAIAAHYNLAGEIQTATPVFADGCGGSVQVGPVVVQFAVRKIGSAPATYRVLFTRLDAGQLVTNMVDRMDALELRIQQLEQA